MPAHCKHVAVSPSGVEIKPPDIMAVVFCSRDSAAKRIIKYNAGKCGFDELFAPKTREGNLTQRTNKINLSDKPRDGLNAIADPTVNDKYFHEKPIDWSAIDKIDDDYREALVKHKLGSART